jgi:hypothetical protein
MSSLIELAKQLLKTHNAKIIVGKIGHSEEADWQGSDGYKYKEWQSKDGKRLISMSICDGPNYNNIRIKDILLNAICGGPSRIEMMRVQEINEPDSKNAKYNVYLDAITEKEDGSWCLTNIAYFDEDNGKMQEPSSWSNPLRKNELKDLSDYEFRKQYIASMKTEGIYHMNEILPEIDIEATVAAFMDQIRKLNFSKPILLFPNKKAFRITHLSLSTNKLRNLRTGCGNHLSR